MKVKELTKQLHKFAKSQEDTAHISEADLEKIVTILFRYLASLSLEDCIDTVNQMVKTGTKVNQLEGKLREKLSRAKERGGFWGWTRPIVNGFDSMWQETARIFNPFSSKF